MTERGVIFTGESVLNIVEGRKSQTRRLLKVKPRDGKVQPLADAEWRFVSSRDTVTGAADYAKGEWCWQHRIDLSRLLVERCPYGKVGDRLWIRETWKPEEDPVTLVDGIRFRADGAFAPIENTKEAAERWIVAYDNGKIQGWRSPLFLPKWAARITLEVTEIRAQRLHELTDADAIAEGIRPLPGQAGPDGKGTPGCQWTGFVAGGPKLHARSPVEAYAKVWDELHGHRAPWQSNPWVWAVTFARVRRYVEALAAPIEREMDGEVDGDDYRGG